MFSLSTVHVCVSFVRGLTAFIEDEETPLGGATVLWTNLALAQYFEAGSVCNKQVRYRYIESHPLHSFLIWNEIASWLMDSWYA